MGGLLFLDLSLWKIVGKEKIKILDTSDIKFLFPERNGIVLKMVIPQPQAVAYWIWAAFIYLIGMEEKSEEHTWKAGIILCKKWSKIGVLHSF